MLPTMVGVVVGDYRLVAIVVATGVDPGQTRHDEGEWNGRAWIF